MEEFEMALREIWSFNDRRYYLLEWANPFKLLEDNLATVGR